MGTSLDRGLISRSKADIRGRKLPNDGINRWDKFYVELAIDGEAKYRTGTAKGNTASWTDSFHL